MKRKTSKKQTCPSCNGKNIATILWGLPLENEDLTKALEEKKIVLGGCCTSENDPIWECNDCYTRIWSQEN